MLIDGLLGFGHFHRPEDFFISRQNAVTEFFQFQEYGDGQYIAHDAQRRKPRCLGRTHLRALGVGTLKRTIVILLAGGTDDVFQNPVLAHKLHRAGA